MYKIRSLTVQRQPQTMIQIAAPSDVIPLKSENWAERWCTLPSCFERELEDVLNFAVRSEDVFVVTFMKCGTTWMQETAWLLMNNLDYESASKAGILDRSVFLEFSGLVPDAVSTVEICNKMPNPRLIKSHLPANLLPKQLWQKRQKTIYVARNLKDVVISSFHFLKGLGWWSGNLNEYVQDFLNGELQYCPYLAHLIDFWEMRNEPFIFFVTYEEMKRDLGAVIQRLCTFLERPQLTESELRKAVDHLSFDKMKNNKQTNLTDMLKDTLPETVSDKFQFMRRGIVGSFKDELTPELQEKLNSYSREFFSKHNIKEEDIFGII